MSGFRKLPGVSLESPAATYVSVSKDFSLAPNLLEVDKLLNIICLSNVVLSVPRLLRFRPRGLRPPKTATLLEAEGWLPTGPETNEIVGRGANMMKRIALTALALLGVAGTAGAATLVLPSNEPVYGQFNNLEQVNLANTLVVPGYAPAVGTQGTWGVFNISSLQHGGVVTVGIDIS